MQPRHRQLVVGIQMRVILVDDVVTDERIGKDTPLIVRHYVAVLEFDPRTLCCCNDSGTEGWCVQSTPSARRSVHMCIYIMYMRRPAVRFEVVDHVVMSPPRWSVLIDRADRRPQLFDI